MSETAEWIVALCMPPHLVGGLSLHQCSVCCALVVEDFMPEHEQWHASITHDPEALGDAWGDGYDAGRGDAESDVTPSDEAANPYRATVDEGGRQ